VLKDLFVFALFSTHYTRACKKIKQKCRAHHSWPFCRKIPVLFFSTKPDWLSPFGSCWRSFWLPHHLSWVYRAWWVLMADVMYLQGKKLDLPG
jgi:hypothetical protein